MKKILATAATALMATAMVAAPAAAQSDNSASQDAPGIIKKQLDNNDATMTAPGQMQLDGEAESASDVAPGQLKTSDETTASIDITDTQKTELRDMLGETDPVEMDGDASLDLTAGATVPDTVMLTPLPEEAAQIVPSYADYEYFVSADGQIVIVAPDTNEIIAVIS